jgi:hypothetical protein
MSKIRLIKHEAAGCGSYEVRTASVPDFSIGTIFHPAACGQNR